MQRTRTGFESKYAAIYGIGTLIMATLGLMITDTGVYVGEAILPPELFDSTYTLDGTVHIRSLRDGPQTFCKYFTGTRVVATRRPSAFKKCPIVGHLQHMF
ncbi:hypothetical protein WBP07_26055 [Novosphingobium sp. BL-8A]|uniref:hypothetical protein n=1 Tax=Novosphingobium sp. BL-8A TaxID=3127639 RepID=UPI0037563E20